MFVCIEFIKLLKRQLIKLFWYSKYTDLENFLTKMVVSWLVSCK